MTRQEPVYLDYAASAPVHPEVAAAMAACLGPAGPHANPSAGHAAGRRAAAAIESARESVARLVGAAPQSILFTSGATESDNLALLGVARAAPPERRHIVTSRSEHRAVLDACRQLEREGCRVSWLRPGPDGRVTPAQVRAALGPQTLLASVMHASNELGVINDVAGIAAVCHEAGVLLHVDAAQTAGRIALDVRTLGADLLAFSAHKLGGPKGIGALFVRDDPRPLLRPLLFGGGQERGLRSGTLATHQIVGFGAACDLARSGLATEEPRVRALRQQLRRRLSEVPQVRFNAADEPAVPGILSVTFPGIEGESLLLHLDGVVDCTTGSACHSATNEPSYVLRGLGLTDLAAQATLRLSVGRDTTAADVERAADAIVEAVAGLRRLAPPGAVERIA